MGKTREKDWASPDVIGGELVRLGLTKYAEYLESEHWQKLRQGYAGQPCCRPGCNRAGTQLHHTTYERLGRERPDDLEWLCRSCHHSAHRRKKRRLKRRAPPESRTHREVMAAMKARNAEKAAREKKTAPPRLPK